MFKIHPTADVANSAQIGQSTVIWHYAQVREDCLVGENVVIGRGVYVGNGVRIGPNSKIQNYALIYEPSLLEAGVFIGPGVILTNDQYPRAVNPDNSKKKLSDWDPVGVTVREGASIGAGSICVAPVEIGRWALVAAGSTVTKNVPAFALVAGVPAKRISWVGKAGIPLTEDGAGRFTCSKTGTQYVEYNESTLVEIEHLEA
jgi:acetyltransferase-like isoleucine patch superfamily enzyme